MIFDLWVERNLFYLSIKTTSLSLSLSLPLSDIRVSSYKKSLPPSNMNESLGLFSLDSLRRKAPAPTHLPTLRKELTQSSDSFSTRCFVTELPGNCSHPSCSLPGEVSPAGGIGNLFRLWIGWRPRERRPPLAQIMTSTLPLGEMVGGRPSEVQWRSPT